MDTSKSFERDEYNCSIEGCPSGERLPAVAALSMAGRQFSDGAVEPASRLEAVARGGCGLDRSHVLGREWLPRRATVARRSRMRSFGGADLVRWNVNAEAFADRACEARSRQEEEVDAWPSSTTTNAEIVRNPHLLSGWRRDAPISLSRLLRGTGHRVRRRFANSTRRARHKRFRIYVPVYVVLWPPERR